MYYIVYFLIYVTEMTISLNFENWYKGKKCLRDPLGSKWLLTH